MNITFPIDRSVTKHNISITLNLLSNTQTYFTLRGNMQMFQIQFIHVSKTKMLIIVF